MIGIYKIENKINHKKYIGQSVDIARRWREEKRLAFTPSDRSYNYPLSRAFRKYGLENFTFEVLEECERESLNEKEVFWIKYYDSFFSGYNQTLGGDCTKSSAPKENILGVFSDLEKTNMLHREIAEKWNLSIEMVQGINTGRYWYQDSIQYPIQKRCKIIKEKNGNGRVPRFCPNCGKQISQKAVLCATCNSLINRKTKRPSREELKQLIRTTPFTTIAKQFGVSDNAVRKWCDSYNLPRKTTEIKKITNENWDKV